MRIRSNCLFLLLLAASFGCSQPPRDADAPPGIRGGEGKTVRQIDHILISSKNADELFALLTKKLQLPVAWPMSDFGGFASGGVAVGNVNLEIIRSDSPGARMTGFALEPEPLADSLRILEQRGITYGPPAVSRSGGFLGFGGKIRWTTVALPGVSSDAAEVFLCEYPDDVSERRRKWSQELRSRGGGPLSIVAVEEIVYGSRKAVELRKRWRELLTPAEESEPGSWEIGAGPAVRVVNAPRDGILGIAIQVRSLSQARMYLGKRGMIREERAGEITLGGREFEGLTVRIVQDGGS